MKKPILLTAAAITAAAAAARASVRRAPDDITGEVAIITGASRGLGLAIARELARHSARLVICARGQDQLERAADDLRALGADVAAVACDLDDEGTAELLIDTALERYGRLDILVNNAGNIQVGPVESTTASDYEAAVRTMALAPVRLTLAALPVMRGQAHGRVVNITSIGGKVSVPHLLPYCTAKFAAVGFSEGLRAELGPGPVAVTTVVPGLMRTGSHLNARFAGRSEEEFTWFSLAASLPVVSLDAGAAAHQIVEAMRQRRAELILTPLGQVAARGAGIFPEFTSALLHLTKQVLPASTGQPGRAVPGSALRPALNQQVFDRLTALGRTAARQFNQLPQPSGSRGGS
ncbi:MAG: short-chain dehydrogenase/reductase [Actinomycetia bacterium]|nr:short-chain dehydrogenase/reductase [Actinomycetes bacterium]